MCITHCLDTIAYAWDSMGLGMAPQYRHAGLGKHHQPGSLKSMRGLSTCLVHGSWINTILSLVQQESESPDLKTNCVYTGPPHLQTALTPASCVLLIAWTVLHMPGTAWALAWLHSTGTLAWESIISLAH